MNTEILQVDIKHIDSQKVQKAAEILTQGGLVAIPTETVYGLAANALDEDAVASIFAAKGRPQDNPLIVHITDIGDLAPLVIEIPENASRLAAAFWPGPLTIILKRSTLVPSVVSAGLNTVAVRMPSHPVAQAIIRAAGFPLAAPSANLSGSPSPTCAAHVLEDMNGRVPLIIDGGECSVGVESTVISLVENRPVILRPGGITKEQIERVIGTTMVDNGVLNRVNDSQKVSSPGMKYKHYSPKASVIIVDADSNTFCNYVNKQSCAFALCFNEDIPKLTIPYVSYGIENNDSSQAHLLFYSLRELDKLGAKTVYARPPEKTGVGLAVYNRLLRAAGFEIIVP